MSGTLGEKVKALRLERGWSQMDLATAAGIEQTAVSRIEVRKGYEPGSYLLYRLARVFDVTMDSLLEGVVSFTPVPIAKKGDEPSSVVVRLGEEVASLGKRQLSLEKTVTEGFESINESLKALAPKKQTVKR